MWLLSPEDRSERIRRQLRFAALDIQGGEAAKKLVGATGPRTEAERIAELRAIAKRRGLDDRAATKHVGYAEIVTAAGDTMLVGNAPFLLTWRMCSAIAHGDLWATLNIVSLTVLPGSPPGFAHMRVAADPRTLFFSVSFGVEMAATGWRLFDQRSMGHAGRPTRKLESVQTARGAPGRGVGRSRCGSALPR